MVANTNTLVSAIKVDLDNSVRTFTLLVDGVEMTINVI